MEFLELFNEAKEFIPKEYENVSVIINSLYPFIYLAISAAVCFFGLKIHHIWLYCFFFLTGFLAGSLSGVFFVNTININVFIILGTVLGLILAHFSKKLHKLQLFVINSFMTFFALLSFLKLIMPLSAAFAVSALAAVAAGIIAVKLKYITTIITTSCMGAAQSMSAIMHLLNMQNKALEICAVVVLAAAGMSLQFWQHNKEHMHEKQSSLQPS